jgi:hypothetical protein
MLNAAAMLNILVPDEEQVVGAYRPSVITFFYVLLQLDQ